AIVAVLRPGVVGTLRQCQAGSLWCKVSVKQYGGWLERSAVWGLLPQEVVSPS
ncbi:SH3 domain-containing protein, partial [Komagataeibacter kakiaceti]|uniref:SH3 domain-containing protein n=1 Tax=Komagataeibacter kakiaceti TaxID=943261 RepID=UPI001F5A8375